MAGGSHRLGTAPSICPGGGAGRRCFVHSSGTALLTRADEQQPRPGLCIAAGHDAGCSALEQSTRPCHVSGSPAAGSASFRRGRLRYTAITSGRCLRPSAASHTITYSHSSAQGASTGQVITRLGHASWSGWRLLRNRSTDEKRCWRVAMKLVGFKLAPDLRLAASFER